LPLYVKIKNVAVNICLTVIICLAASLPTLFYLWLATSVAHALVLAN
jgi:hypothetical protein